jgi:hypothetical protein
MATEQDIQEAADQHYASRFAEIERLDELAAMADILGHAEWCESMNERLTEMPLCVDLVAIYPNRDLCEWEILLGTGGPADRVLVTTDFDGSVEDASYQYQDWFTPWTDARGQDSDLVSRFVARFYFGTVADWTESLARR